MLWMTTLFSLDKSAQCAKWKSYFYILGSGHEQMALNEINRKKCQRNGIVKREKEQ